MEKVRTLLKRPKIRFDDHRVNYIIVNEGDDVTVWLDTIYNTDSYGMSLATALTASVVTPFQFTVTADILGFHRVFMDVTNTETGQSADSNSLIIIVV